MKDILITVISILLTVVIIICMVKGLTVGSFHILSISNIKQESLNLDNEVNIIDIPVSINDPLQMKIVEEQITSIIVQENIREEHYTNEQEEQEDNILEI